jgi:hypothetical protein
VFTLKLPAFYLAGDLIVRPVSAESAVQGTKVDVKEPGFASWPCAPIAATNKRMAATTTPMSVASDGSAAAGCAGSRASVRGSNDSEIAFEARETQSIFFIENLARVNLAVNLKCTMHPFS